jgi:uncharacterized membrane protein HdeD (DUF308 family)
MLGVFVQRVRQVPFDVGAGWVGQDSLDPSTPPEVMYFLVQVLGLYLFIAGLFRIIGIFVDLSFWGWKLLAGVLCIIAGVLVLRHPLWSGVLVPTVVVFYIGFLSIFEGGIGIFVAFRGGGWGVGVLGALGVLFGFILVINPLIGVAALPFVLGIFMLVGGVAAVVQAFRMRWDVVLSCPERNWVNRGYGVGVSLLAANHAQRITERTTTALSTRYSLPGTIITEVGKGAAAEMEVGVGRPRRE